LRGRYYFKDILSGAVVIHQLKCRGLGSRPTVPEIIFKCEVAGSVLKIVFFLENCYYGLMVLSKCKNSHISPCLSLIIMSPNSSVEITLTMLQYDLRVGFSIIPISIIKSCSTT
jgi:hypothetical protein